MLRYTAVVVLLAPFCLALAKGQESQAEKKLIIRLKNGKTVVYSLSEVESIQFEDTKGTGGAATEGHSGADQPIGPVRLLRGAGALGGAWGPENLFDGSGRTGWSSRPDARFPHEFIIELPRSAVIGALEFDNATQEAGYPGSSARDVNVLGSNVGPSGPYVTLASVGLARGVNSQRFTVGPATVRWLRILINSNYGHPNYTQLMDLRLYPPPDPNRQ